MSADRPDPPPAGLAWFGTYFNYWSAQITSVLLGHALQEQVVEIPAGGPVCSPGEPSIDTVRWL